MAEPIRIPTSQLRSKLQAAVENAARASLAWSEPPPRPQGLYVSEDAWIAQCEQRAADYGRNIATFEALQTKLGDSKPGDETELPADVWQLLRSAMRPELPDAPPPDDFDDDDDDDDLDDEGDRPPPSGEDDKGDADAGRSRD